jgi:hypothetical protein
MVSAFRIERGGGEVHPGALRDVVVLAGDRNARRAGSLTSLVRPTFVAPDEDRRGGRMKQS